MAILADVSFNDVPVSEAYVKIERIWGSSKEGWSALVSESTSKENADKSKNFNTFNFSTPYVEGVNCYTSMYGALKEQKYPSGIDVLETEE